MGLGRDARDGRVYSPFLLFFLSFFKMEERFVYGFWAWVWVDLTVLGPLVLLPCQKNGRKKVWEGIYV